MLADQDNWRARRFLYYSLGIFFVYLAIRVLAWSNTVLLEDTDSLGNMRWIKVFLHFDLKEIINIDPDFTPFYLFFSALSSLLTGSVETGARLCSLVFSIILFASLAGIGRYITKPFEASLGLALLSLSPALIGLSFAVLTEPSYIATVYLGLWLFWTQYEHPAIGKAALLGVVFGLSFLNRLEGIIFLGVIPFLQTVHFLFEKGRKYSLKNLTAWIAVFVLVFSAVIGPQIWRVSNIVGDLALNGRQVWSVVMNNPDGKTYNEKIHGLDFSPGQRNIDYLKRHPEAWKKMTSTFEPGNYVATVIDNIRDLKRHRLAYLIGYAGLIFFVFGLVALYRSGRLFEAFVVVSFIGASLVPPLLHNVVIRHIAVIAPIMFLVIAIGIVYASRLLAGMIGQAKIGARVMPFAFLVLVTGPSAPHLWHVVVSPATANTEYSPAELEKPLQIVRAFELEHKRKAVITADRGYLAHYANARQAYIPHADYTAVLRYIDLNKVDFVYLKENRLRKNPFYQTYLKQGFPENYVHLYGGLDAGGGKIELYRVIKKQ